LAAYALLAAVAQRAGDEQTAAVARQIEEQERAMAERLANSFDLAVSASFAALAPQDLTVQVSKYLQDAHALEGQSAVLLAKGPQLAGAPELAAIYEEHLAETREHQRLVEDRLGALGAGPSAVKDTALRIGALNWGMFFAAQPDTPAKLAGFAYALEHLEVAAYELLRRVAQRADDAVTDAMAQGILDQENLAARRIREHFDAAIEAGLREQGLAAR
jgi:ferritin-like metal-binding protein YciE